MHFNIADVDVPRVDAVAVAFYLDPAANFDVNYASGVNAGVDVSVDIDAAPHVDVDAMNIEVAAVDVDAMNIEVAATRIVLDAPNRSSQDKNLVFLSGGVVRATVVSSVC